MTQYKLVVDCTTGKQEYIALTPAEIAERDQQAAAAAEEQAKRDADKAALDAARESGKLKLSSIGLTEEEIKAFGF
jgi:hypothetical protein